jgi:integrase-like protein
MTGVAASTRNMTPTLKRFRLNVASRGFCRRAVPLVISEPKTTHSRREVPLHATTVAMLLKHRIAQMEERMAAANVWIDEGLVFTTETAARSTPRNLRVIEKAAATAKVEGVGVHTLRHSAATRWLESGIHVKQVDDLLGHYSTSITGGIYGDRSDDGARAGHREARRAARTLGMSQTLVVSFIVSETPGGTGVYRPKPPLIYVGLTASG